MSTLTQMVDQTISEMVSYVRNQEAITVTTGTVDDSVLTFSIDDAEQVSRGIVEIGDELVYVKSVNKTSGIANVMPGGRGYRGTTAASHGANTIVRNNPLFPRAMVKRALNETIKGIDLRALGSHDFTFDGTAYAYVLPVDFKEATGVSWSQPNSTNVWPMIQRYRIDRNYQLPDSTTMRTALVLHEFPMPGRTVRVQYAKWPSELTDSDEFSVTGLPASSEDVIRMGAMWRLLSTVDPGKVVSMTPQADLIDSPVAPGDASTASRYLYQMFQIRLAEEKAKQAINFSTVINYAR